MGVRDRIIGGRGVEGEVGAQGAGGGGRVGVFLEGLEEIGVLR